MNIVIVLGLVGAAFAAPKSTERIVGGSPTSVSEYPFMSNMQYSWGGISYYQGCGGTLITTWTVVSAAHCYYGDSPSSWRVRLGTSWRSLGGGSDYLVSALTVHEAYDPVALTDDVALVRLETEAVLTANVYTVWLPYVDYFLHDGTVVTAVGWGTLSSGGVAPQRLQHVEVNVINQEVCAERYASLKSQPGYEGWPDITEGMLCAGILDVGGKDACQGDSGGPLVFQGDTLVGITSWGAGCADPLYPGVNTRVTHYYDWIIAHLTEEEISGLRIK